MMSLPLTHASGPMSCGVFAFLGGTPLAQPRAVF
jgi:hypothetical protein